MDVPTELGPHPLLAPTPGPNLARHRYADQLPAGTRFHGANLTLARFENLDLTNVSFDQAQLAGARFHHCQIGPTTFAGAVLYRTQLVFCQGAEHVEAPFGSPQWLVAPHPEAVDRGPAGCEPQLVVDPSRVEHVAFDPTGRYLAAAQHRSIPVWDVVTGEQVWCLTSDDHPDAGWGRMAWHPAGTHIVAVGKHLVVWEVATGRQTLMLPLDMYDPYVAFDPTGALLAVGTEKQAWILDADTGLKLLTLPGCGSVVGFGGQRFFASSSTMVFAWDVTTGEQLLKTSIRRHHYSLGGAIDPAGTKVVTNWGKKSDHSGDLAAVWDVATGERLVTLEGHTSCLSGACFDRSGTRLVTSSWDGTARVWDVATGAELVKVTGGETLYSGAISPDGGLVATGSSDGQVHLWSAETGRRLHVLSHGKPSLSYWVHPAADLVSTATDVVRLWRLSTGEYLTSLAQHGAPISLVDVSPDGTRLVTTSQGEKTTRLWDVTTGECLSVLDDSRWMERVAFDPTGRLALGVSRIWEGSKKYGALTVWDVATWSTSVEHKTSYDSTAAFDRTGRHIVLAHDDQVTVLRSDDGTVARTFDNNASATSIAIDPFRDQVAFMLGSGSVNVWDVTTGTHLFVLAPSRKSHGVAELRFAPDGRRVVAGRPQPGGEDDQVRGRLEVWNLPEPGESVQIVRSTRSIDYSSRFVGHTGSWIDSAVTPDGWVLVLSGGRDALTIFPPLDWDALTTATSIGSGVFSIQLVGAGAVVWRDGRAEPTPEVLDRVCWLVTDPETGIVARCPAETFGPFDITSLLPPSSV
ncbi:MAG: pentapeptide repeat-containing protein [Micrococcales bacterium]|nr:pentapeptide repeat-containing protein [Micrococcales bacterium]